MKNVLFLLALITGLLHAQKSTSTNYILLHSDPTSAGASISSTTGSITAETAIGGTFSSVSSAGTIQAKVNFIALLYDPVSLAITASANPINEGNSPKLSATALMDDETTLSLPSVDVTWSILSGPFTNITPSGIANTSPVYQDETAQVQGSSLGLSGTEDITVRNINDDNLGSYANDGLDDWWQVQFFGFENSDAAPDQDPDGDKQNNAFENLAGIDPTDAASFFKVRIETTVNNPTKRTILYSPYFSDRTYTLLATPNLMNTFTEVTDTRSSNKGDGEEAEITDETANELLKFYRIGISR